MSKANDMQIAGDHYASPYQHWDFVYDAWRGDYLKSAASKYITRGRKKNGAEDLRKAMHFIIKAAEAKHPLFRASIDLDSYLEAFRIANQLNAAETLAIRHIGYGEWDNAAKVVQLMLDSLIKDSE